MHSIDEIEVGDEVANNEPGGEDLEAHEVVAVRITDADEDYVDLTIATPDGPKTIPATAHHPFCNAGESIWEDAADLTAGEQLTTPGNGRASVASTRHYSADLRTYNLTVETVHTYYVVAEDIPVLVHNTGPCLESFWPGGKPSSVCKLRGARGARTLPVLSSGMMRVPALRVSLSKCTGDTSSMLTN